MKSTEQAFEELLEAEEMDMEEFCDEYAIESVVPGICMNEGCTYTTTAVEPDQREGWCECCETNTVISGVELLFSIY